MIDIFPTDLRTTWMRVPAHLALNGKAINNKCLCHNYMHNLAS